MENRRQVIIIDVDGTFFDTFAKEDCKIISEIFQNSNVIKNIDCILQKLNSLDFVTNSMWILALRLYVYSLFSSKLSYKEVIKKYKELYLYYFNNCYESQYNLLEELMKAYDIIFVTNNTFTLNTNLAREFRCFYAKNNIDRSSIVTNIVKMQKVKYLFGNNFMDDYFVAKRNNIQFVYIGKSKLVEILSKTDGFKTFEDAIGKL